MSCSTWEVRSTASRARLRGFSSGLCYRDLGRVILLSWAEESYTVIVLRVHLCSSEDAVDTLLSSLFSQRRNQPYEVSNVFATTSQRSWSVAGPEIRPRQSGSDILAFSAYTKTAFLTSVKWG